MKIYVKKIALNLSPVDEDSAEVVKKLSPDSVYSVEIKKLRNVKFHNKFFALINLGYDNTKLDVPKEVYRKIMIMKAGYFDAYNTGKGTYFEAKSISFYSMEEDEFQELYSRVLDKIIEDLDVTKEWFTANLLPFI